MKFLVLGLWILVVLGGLWNNLCFAFLVVVGVKRIEFVTVKKH